jgi:hypothetical protein
MDKSLFYIYIYIKQTENVGENIRVLSEIRTRSSSV